MNELVSFATIAALPVLLAGATLLFFRRVAHRPRVGALAVVTGNALVLLTLAALVLLGFETHLRFFYDASDGDNRTQVSKRWFARHWKRNNFGLRDDIDYPLQPTPGKPRITFVGDSFTAGHGVPDVSVRYVNRLRASHPEWEVHSIAIPGLETPEETQLLRRLVGNGYQLDVVVLAYYLENIGRFVPELHEYYERAAKPPPPLLALLMRWSYVVDTFTYRLQTRWMYAQGYWSGVYERAYAGPPWEAQQRAFRTFRALVEQHGGRFAALTFPTLSGVEHNREMAAQVDAFFRAEGVPHLDLSPVLAGRPVLELVANPHDAHPSALTHQLAAEAIEAFLLERVLPEERPAGGEETPPPPVQAP